MRQSLVCVGFVVATTCLPTCLSGQSAAQPEKPAQSNHARPSLSDIKPTDLPGVHNVVMYAPNLYSGGVPEDEAGFNSLQALGIKTIISVDGAQPEVDLAKARGMKYIHLPIGYNGMDKDRTLQISKAIEQGLMRGPVFVHCHHGKHRSAGAAGAAAVTLGLLSKDAATARMKVSGTAPNYIGLFRCVAVADKATPEELAAVADDFPEHFKTGGMVNTMVEVDETFDHLKLIEKAGWVAPKDHPDLVPAAEAGRMADLFRNVRDDAKVKPQPVELSEWLGKASAQAEAVEAAIVARKPATEISERFKVITQSCKDCHAKYRD